MSTDSDFARLEGLACNETLGYQRLLVIHLRLGPG